MKIRRSKTQPVPPIVVRSDEGTTEGAWRHLAAELAPVLTIMDKLGLTAAGYRIAQRGRFEVHAGALGIDPTVAERLKLARGAIREEARKGPGFWTLPDAVLVLDGLAVELFGDAEPGEPRDRYSYGAVRLVLVTEAEEGRWVLVA